MAEKKNLVKRTKTSLKAYTWEISLLASDPCEICGLRSTKYLKKKKKKKKNMPVNEKTSKCKRFAFVLVIKHI